MIIHRYIAAAAGALAAAVLLSGQVHGQGGPAPAQPATLQIDLGAPGKPISPTLYGLMTEEINHSYDGGIYAELIQNRVFKDDPASPVHWSLFPAGAPGAIALDTSQPLNTALDTSLKLTVSPGASGWVGAANDGYWGISVKPSTQYRASFWAKAAPGFAGPVQVAIESPDGSRTYAQAQVPKITQAWAQYTSTLTTTAAAAPTANAQFVVAISKPGTVWLDLVSLFPPTFHNRPNGNRIDIMQTLGALQPSFLRLPGGDYLEGETIDTRFDWKKTIGPLENRPGHPGPWSYRSSDGLGLLEYLEWCEDLKMEPVLAVYAGYSRYHHKVPNPETVPAGPGLQPFVQDALDEIEYATGPVTTPWGAKRAADGHPAPFPLHYVEIGNEDFFDKAGTYDGRFAQFYDAIRAKYPALQLIATTKVRSRTPDVVDEHYYKTAVAIEGMVHLYDSYSRTGPKVFVGEWATREGVLTPNMNAALGDSAWMTGLERNADVVVLSCYAPLLTNVNPGAHQWRTDLVGYDALSCYGSPSYYAQVMFRHALGDTIVPAMFTGGSLVFESVTRSKAGGALYIKLVNASGDAQSVQVAITGARSVAPRGTSTVLRGSDPTDTNSIDNPTKIVPVTTPLAGLGPMFAASLPPYSITVLQLQAQ